MCNFPECSKGEPDNDGNLTPYVTPVGLKTKDEVSGDLRAHELPLRHAEAAVAKVKADTEKIQAETARVVADRPVPETQRPAAPQPAVGPAPSQGERRDRIL